MNPNDETAGRNRSEPAYFFDPGLRFACRGCGTCCTGEPGTVYVSGDEISAIAQYLEISEAAFRRRFAYPFRDSFSLKERRDGSCCFYDHGCRVYPVRPGQCRTYPFWFDIMRSEKRWREAARDCPGIGQGRRFSREEILSQIAASYPGAARKEGKDVR